MFEANACREVVSILEAIVFGAGDACIDVGMTSILSGVALFIGAVVLLRLIGARLLRRVFPSRRPTPAAEDVTLPAPSDPGVRPLPYESPIRSTGAWGGKASDRRY